MTFAVKVQGGTGAGSKQPKRAKVTEPWTCQSGHENPSYAATCLTTGCRDRRP